MSKYAELHCHSNFSFLDGASHPEALVEEAVRLELAALALTDHNGLYGVVRFAQAARAFGLPTVFGAELTLGASSSAHTATAPDPDETHLLIVAQGPVGYARLARAVSLGQLAGTKGAPQYHLEMLADAAVASTHGVASATTNDAWFVLTGCRKGPLAQALMVDGPLAARRALDELIAAFGRSRVVVELWDHGDPLDRARNDELAAIAMAAGVDVVATNNVHYATPAQHRLAQALAAVRARRSLDEMTGWLPAAPLAHLRSAVEQEARFARWPGAVAHSAVLAAQCAFDLRIAAPQLPPYPVPEGHTEATWVRELTHRGAAVRYPPTHPQYEQAQRQLAYELDVITTLGFSGYFLVLHDIVAFCRTHDIFCQGRGSAANSAVCYALGVTKADAVALGLLFERFLSPERDGPPDIDIDIEHQRREEVIQYVYERYGRTHAAQVANVITYRSRSAIREMAKATGASPGQADALARHVERWTGPDASGQGVDVATPTAFRGLRSDTDAPEVSALTLDLATQVLDYPRHLGIHSGGMVIADRPLIEYCPVEWARMEGRSVLQWDKDDCAAAGLVKFDLLGLGMLSMLHRAVDLVARHDGITIDLATIPQEDAVYAALADADSIGVFQVESRAQMATLPRLRPQCFYDLVVEVALIRPGPIQGGSVHPYLRRRNGEEPVTYLHPLLEKSLAKTLGVPLFQEQLMQMAIDVADFSPAEADQLRQAMGSKRSKARMAQLRDRLLRGMASKGITGETADAIIAKLEAFADFGFPESHSVSFAYLVYASAWIKFHHPDAFLCALLNAQPMGFYSPHTLIRDARRHGVEVLGPDVNASQTESTLVARPPGVGPIGVPQPGWHAEPSTHAVRLGLQMVQGLSAVLLDRIADARADGPFVDLESFTRRTEAGVDALEALATAGAFECFGIDRRSALWAAGALRDARPTTRGGVTIAPLPALVTGADAPPLPGMTPAEVVTCDLWSMGASPDRHPTEFVRDHLAATGVSTAAMLRGYAHGTIVEIAGVVTHRQQPSTAKGTVFLNIEDETGLINVICAPGVWKRFRSVARGAPALRVRGVLEVHHGVYNVLAHRIGLLGMPAAGQLPRRSWR